MGRAGPVVTADLTGNVYALDLRDDAIEWLLPAGLGVVTDYVGNISSLLVLVEEAGETLTLTVAVGQTRLGELRQYDCLGPVAFPPVDFSTNPDFAIGPQPFTLTTGTVDYTIEDLRLDGTFAEDGASIERFRVRGYLDVRRIDENARIDICSFARAADDPCVPCDDEGEGEDDPSCLPIDAIAYTIPRSEVPVDPDVEPECELPPVASLRRVERC